MIDSNIPAPPRPGIYYADSLLLYGAKMNQREEYGRFNVGQGGDTELRVQIFKARQAQTSKDYSIVLAYGYAFEGHCYRLDSNRIFIVTGPPMKTLLAAASNPR
ncbi:hypothetical protein [Mesorhizobium sp. C277A]|uniref:hypothetical protein n=1 Tax=Mesorhizobium sp. C277A TaxID=2956827 RepID=UPI00333B3178